MHRHRRRRRKECAAGVHEGVVHALGRLEEGVDVRERAVVHRVAGEVTLAADGRLRGGDVGVAGGRAAAPRRCGVAVGTGAAATVILRAGREWRGAGGGGGGGGGGDALDGLGRHGGGWQVEREAEREVEVGRGRGALEAEQRGVVGARRGVGGGVGSQPYPRLLARRPDLRHPRAPAPHPHALVRPLLATAAVLR